jgi:carbon-monoxide dehydrogenase medium subunit
MKVFDSYHLPVTAAEALELLAQYEGAARVIAGGTDLLVDTQAEFHAGHRPHFAALVDVTRIAGATEIRVEGEQILIGCGVTHTTIVNSPLIQARATALAEACAVVGGPQVRNVATLIGNVAHALPAADGTVALLAFDAEAQVASRAGNGAAGDEEVIYEWRPLSSLFRGPGQSAVDATRELILAVRLTPTSDGSASAFSRVMRPQGVALPILGMAVRVSGHREDSRWVLDDVAVSVGPVAPVPFRARQTEMLLRGRSLDDALVREAAEVLVAEAKPRTSPHRSTREYRVELLPSLLEHTLTSAVERLATDTRTHD